MSQEELHKKKHKKSAEEYEFEDESLESNKRKRGEFEDRHSGEISPRHLKEQPHQHLKEQPLLLEDQPDDDTTPDEGLNSSYQIVELICEELPRNTKEQHLREFFAKYKTSIKCVQRERGNPIAIVTFPSCEEACAAYDSLRDQLFMGKKIKISFPKTKKDQLFPKFAADMKAKIKLDRDSLNGLCDQTVADSVTKIMKVMLNKLGISQGLIITEGAAGIGGCSLSFSKVFSKVRAVEVDKTRFEMLNYNKKVCCFENIKTYNDDYLALCPKLKQHVVFLDPPCNYSSKEENLEIRMGDSSLYQIVRKIIDCAPETNTRIIVLKLPLNADLNELKQHAKCEKDTKEDIQLEKLAGKWREPEGDKEGGDGEEKEEEKEVTGIGTTINTTGDAMSDTPSIGNGTYSMLQCTFHKMQIVLIDCFSTFRHFISRAHFLPRKNVSNYKLQIYYNNNFVPMGFIRKMEASKEKDSRIWNSNLYQRRENRNNAGGGAASNSNLGNTATSSGGALPERGLNKPPRVGRRDPRDIDPSQQQQRREPRKDFREMREPRDVRREPREPRGDREMNRGPREPRGEPGEPRGDREMNRGPREPREPRGEPRGEREIGRGPREPRGEPRDNRDPRNTRRGEFKQERRASPEQKRRRHDFEEMKGREQFGSRGEREPQKRSPQRISSRSDPRRQDNFYEDEEIPPYKQGVRRRYQEGDRSPGFSSHDDYNYSMMDDYNPPPTRERYVRSPPPSRQTFNPREQKWN